MSEKSFFCIFFAEIFGQFKKKQYFCTRFLIEGTCTEKKIALSAFEKSSVLLLEKFAEIAQLVEHDLAKVGVASSSLVFRSFFFAQMAELVDACVSGAHAARCAGSSPVLGTHRAGGEIGIHATLRG